MCNALKLHVSIFPCFLVDVSLPEVSKDDLPARVQDFLRYDDEQLDLELDQQINDQVLFLVLFIVLRTLHSTCKIILRHGKVGLSGTLVGFWLIFKAAFLLFLQLSKLHI